MGRRDVHRTLITTAKDDDRAAVVQLWRDCGLTRPWNDADADFNRALDTTSSDVLIARDADAIVGSAMVGFDGHRGWIYYLAVAEPARGRGLGRALMEASEAWLRATGAPKIQLMVRADNQDAIRFYRALGLEQQDVVTLGRFLTEGA